MLQVRAALGAIVWLATVVSSPAVSPAEEVAALSAARGSITAAELKAHVDVLADDTFEGREGGSRGGRAAGNYLVRLLDQYQLKPAGADGGYFQSFGGYRNVLGLLEGSDPELKQEVIVIGAHYDHVGYGRQSNSYGPTGYIHNGADDNASGAAGLLETVDAFSRLPAAPRRSILFAFFDGEENGLLGSKHWLAQSTLPKRRVVFMVNLDMIGRLRKERLELYGGRTTYSLRRLLARHNQDLGLDLVFDWAMREDSDHYSFFARGIPTLMLHTGLHEDYHRPSDDAHKINAEGMRQVTALLFALAHDLADRPKSTAFRAASRRESTGSQTVLEAPLPNAPPRLGVTWTRHDPAQPGLVLSMVQSGAPAERAGIRVGDRLLEFAGKRIADDKQFVIDVLAASSPATAVVERPGAKEPLTLSVTLVGPPIRVGISWREDDAEPGTVLLTQVMSGSPAQRAGLQLRDRIYEVAGQEFSGGTELRERLSKLAGPVELLIERRGRLQRMTVELPPLPERP